MRLLICVMLASLFAIDSIADEHTTIIHAGTLLAVPGDAPQNNQSIVIKGGQITRVEDGFIDSADVSGDVTVIDLSDKFVLPGLMDMHVHLLFELGPNARMQALQVTTSMRAVKGAMYAKRTLDAGFTTVRDLGGEPEAIYALRDAIDSGFVPGPRIIAAGSSLAATGGHGDGRWREGRVTDTVDTGDDL